MFEKTSAGFLPVRFNRKIVGFLAVFCLLLFAALSARAAVSEDSVSSNGAFDTLGVTSLSWSHTVGTGASRALFVGVSTSNTTLGVFPTQRVSSVMYGSQTLTRVGTQISLNGTNAIELFQLVAPISGTNTITVSLVPAAANYVVGGAISFAGVNQTTPEGGFHARAGNSDAPTVPVPDTAAGDIVLSVLAASPNALFFVPTGVAHVQRWDGESFFSNAFDIGAGSVKPGAAPSVTINWALTFADNWALGAIAVKSAPPTAASVTISGRVLTPTGRGVAGARLILTESDGSARSTVSNAFGYYRFADVSAGQTATLEARSKRFEFAPQTFSVTEEIKDLNFTAVP